MELLSAAPSRDANGMAEVLDWLMGDAASSGAGPVSEDGSAAGDPDSLEWDPVETLCGRPSGGWSAVGVDELDRLLDSEVCRS